ncbi:MAG: Hpt domain-containing protein [Holophagaceae bacterium]|nr:Hpt domain-containing protein [Holophagaceae bacterium]
MKFGDVPESAATPDTPPPKTADWMPISVDSKTLLELCRGDVMSANEILNDFIATTKEDVQLMRDCLQQQDMPCVVRQSHRLKGSAAMIGACDLADRAAALEAYAKTETADWETIKELLAGIQEALKEVGRVV